MKIAIVGSSGAGKSTLAIAMSEVLDIPVDHLDLLYWRPGWVKTPKDSWLAANAALVQKEKWIIDGNYGSTVGLRLQAADLVVFLDLPRSLTTFRLLKRRIVNHGKSRPDLNEACPESLDFAHIKYVWHFRKRHRPNLLKTLDQDARGKVIALESKAAVALFLKDLQRGGLSFLQEALKSNS